MIGITQGILVMIMKRLSEMLVVKDCAIHLLLTMQLGFLMIPILDMGMMMLSYVMQLGMIFQIWQLRILREGSRVVFRKLGFVMIYTVASEISLSDLTPSLALI